MRTQGAKDKGPRKYSKGEVKHSFYKCSSCGFSTRTIKDMKEHEKRAGHSF